MRTARREYGLERLCNGLWRVFDYGSKTAHVFPTRESAERFTRPHCSHRFWESRSGHAHCAACGVAFSVYRAS